jgi:hypothetical protein
MVRLTAKLDSFNWKSMLNAAQAVLFPPTVYGSLETAKIR